MSADLESTLIVRLVLAAVLGAALGLERERLAKPAGIRTHSLVSLGAALFTVVGSSAEGWSDPVRVAAQVVSGIGFVGAGVILRGGLSVRGVTTAATLWVAAALGVACGLGFGLLAGATVVMSALISVFVGPLLRKVVPSLVTVLEMEYQVGHGTLGDMFHEISNHGGLVKEVRMTNEEGRRVVHLEIEGADRSAVSNLVNRLARRREVLRVHEL